METIYKKYGYLIRIGFISIIFLASNSFAQNPGNALDFDGTDDYVSIPDAAALDITDQITIEGWFKPSSSSWAFKKSITIHSTQVSATLTDFPVLVSVIDNELKDSNNGGSIQPDGDDILFKTTGGTKLSHEIEKYDGTTGELVAWVKIPSLSSSTDTEFNLHYGNSSCSSQQDAANVWDSNFKAVWHLGDDVVDEASGGIILESTSNPNQGTQNGTVEAAGRIGLGQQFDGDNDYINGGNDVSLRIRDEITIQSWIKIVADPGKDNWFDCFGMDGAYDLYIYGESDTKSILGSWFTLDGKAKDNWESGVVDIAPAVWAHVALTFDGTDIKGYVNGKLDFTMNEPGTIDSVTNDFIIGDYLIPTVDPINGIIDEVRVSNSVRDSSWIGTEYRNQNSPGTFMTVSNQTAAGVSKSSAYGIGTDNSLAFGMINGQMVSSGINSGEWNHICLSYNKDAGGTDEIKLYVNGTESATLDYSTAIATNNENLLLGGIEGFFGEMDEIRLWNDVRTEQEIRENMRRVVTPGSETNLVGYWKLDESSGTTASDSKGSNTGTLTNMEDTDWILSTAPFGGGSANSQASFTSGTANIGTFSLTTTEAFDNSIDITSTEILNGPNTLPVVANQLEDWYWVVDVFGTPGSFTANLTFTLDPGHLTIGDEVNLKLYHRSSNSEGSWTEVVAGASSMTSTTITFNGVSALGQFTIGSSGDSPLPVELTSFTADFVDELVILNWSTATEVNNYGFEIERTLSGAEAWEVIGFVEGHGNSNSPKIYEFVDSDSPEGELEYRLKQIDTDGVFEYFNQIASISKFITDVDDNEIPNDFTLDQNYPNPFNPSTTIAYNLPKNGYVELTIYDMLGNEIKTLVNDQKEAGNHQVKFDASNLSSGMYIYRLSTAGFSDTKKMLLMK